MRYVINDDDLEDWYQRISLSKEFGETNADQLEYVLSEMKAHIDHPLAFDEDQKMKQEIVRLKAMVFHFTGKME
jgi:hypothetical protein